MAGKIENCLMNDTDDILSLYQSARELQTSKGMVVWPVFEKRFIEKKQTTKDKRCFRIRIIFY